MTKAESLRFMVAASLAILCSVGPCGLSSTAFAADKPQAGTAPDVDSMISDAIGLLRANQNAEAASELKQALKINPNSAEAHHNYGLALAKMGDMPGAIEELKQATILKPDLDASWLTLGGLEQSAGQIDEALASYREWERRFADRTDLNETRSKIDALITALGQEKAKKEQAGLLQQDRPAPLQATRQRLLQTPAAVVGNDDYVVEATKGKIVVWPASRMPLRVAIHDARAAAGFKPRWRDILIRSFNDWAAASNGRVSFKFVDEFGAPNCDLECQFSPSSASNDGAAAEGEAGQASMYYGQSAPEPNTYLQYGKLTFFTKSMSDMLPLTDNRMRTICLHEIGHALGITGHTTNPDDIMFYSSSFKDQWRDLSGRDARTIQRLYSSK
ncbi:MAG TPA: tetratricopeptide repeat protein [Candidatus Obscuribacterales bacterium]